MPGSSEPSNGFGADVLLLLPDQRESFATNCYGETPLGQMHVALSDPARDRFFGTLGLHTAEVSPMRFAEMKAQATTQHLKQILIVVLDPPTVLQWDRAP